MASLNVFLVAEFITTGTLAFVGYFSFHLKFPICNPRFKSFGRILIARSFYVSHSYFHNSTCLKFRYCCLQISILILGLFYLSAT